MSVVCCVIWTLELLSFSGGDHFLSSKIYYHFLLLFSILRNVLWTGNFISPAHVKKRENWNNYNAWKKAMSLHKNKRKTRVKHALTRS